MKTAIVYDRVNKWGGAERVLLTLNQMFPDAPLYTSFYNPKKAPWAKAFPSVHVGFLNKLSFIRDKHQLMPVFMPFVFETLSSNGEFDKYDLVVSVTSESAKGIITKPQTKHLCYCLTPNRYLWSGYQQYFEQPLFKQISKPFVGYVRKWDQIASQRPDVIVAISTDVQKRIKKYYQRESEIIFPPVDVKRFKKKNPQKVKINSNSKYAIPITKYYLIVSRLVPYKKVDLALDAFSSLGLPLVVVGTGSEGFKYRLKYKKFKNIVFTGFVADEQLADIYRAAKALIYPQEEDFGITAVEAQAAGIPVIAYKAGGVLDSVIDNKTGIFFEKQTKYSLISAIRKFNRLKLKPSDCMKNADRFDTKIFKDDFENMVEKLI